VRRLRRAFEAKGNHCRTSPAFYSILMEAKPRRPARSDGFQALLRPTPQIPAGAQDESPRRRGNRTMRTDRMAKRKSHSFTDPVRRPVISYIAALMMAILHDPHQNLAGRRFKCECEPDLPASRRPPPEAPPSHSRLSVARKEFVQSDPHPHNGGRPAPYKTPECPRKINSD